MGFSGTNRYSRQTLFAPIGQDGQEKLRHSRVAVVGMGALGTVSATQLVRAGIGHVRLVDRDIIEPSNLQRQSLYDERDAQLGRAKAEAAAEKLKLANSDVDLSYFVTDLNGHNAEALLTGVDVIVDGTDNLETRYLLNEVSVKHGIPWSYGGAVSSYGTTAFLRPGETPCLVCLFGEYQGHGHDTCDTVGVIAPVITVVASLQVAEILKYLTDNRNALSPGLTTVDLWHNEFQHIRFNEVNSHCPCCEEHHYPLLNATTNAQTVSLCGRKTIQVRPTRTSGFDFEQVAKRLHSVGELRHNGNLLQCTLGDVKMTLFADGRALFHGLENPAEARTLYARYVGS